MESVGHRHEHGAFVGLERLAARARAAPAAADERDLDRLVVLGAAQDLREAAGKRGGGEGGRGFFDEGAAGEDGIGIVLHREAGCRGQEDTEFNQAGKPILRTWRALWRPSGAFFQKPVILSGAPRGWRRRCRKNGGGGCGDVQGGAQSKELSLFPSGRPAGGGS